MAVTVIPGDCREFAAEVEFLGPQFAAIITDPPYNLASIQKRFGSGTAAPAKSEGETGVYRRASAGFMGKTWDSDVAFDPATWQALGELLPPGGHVAAFGGTRTFHRLACALEDAGFEIRDCLMWVYGTGFPKSHDVSKAIDKAAGAERVKVPHGAPVARMVPGADQNATGSWIKTTGRTYQPGTEIPATPAAAAWEGWGTALKPAWEPIILARKPLGGRTVAQCVQEFGTGALNIDACRVGEREKPRYMEVKRPGPARVFGTPGGGGKRLPPGRFPANVVHDGSDDVADGFPDPKSARFFYSAKASAKDRARSKHPTVKPVALMRWLVDLLVPPGGQVLDPFAGSGTTGQACLDAGVDCTLVELTPEYQADLQRRFAEIVGEAA